MGRQLGKLSLALHCVPHPSSQVSCSVLCAPQARFFFFLCLSQMERRAKDEKSLINSNSMKKVFTLALETVWRDRRGRLPPKSRGERRATEREFEPSTRARTHFGEGWIDTDTVAGLVSRWSWWTRIGRGSKQEMRGEEDATESGSPTASGKRVFRFWHHDFEVDQKY